ncbi:MAG: PIG-L family deacetylase [bacterium]
MPQGFDLRAAFLLAAAGLAVTPAHAAAPRPAGELLRAIRHLPVAGSVLYVAAHPDDENTRLIAWLVGQRGLRTTYLSMTRGGGGQNLIGTEQAAHLGVVRTGELLAARSVDGADQRFTRARDFGYSKGPDETLATWDQAAILRDVVFTVRAERPDVIITRFEPTGPNHGHHTASAILAAEAFQKAADPAFDPGPLPAWQADRLVHNQSHWRITPETDTSGWLSLDVGAFDPLIGRSYSEVAALSRSMHKSQGFGSAPQIGPQIEYFTPVAGTPIQVGADLFAGLDLTLARFPGSEPLLKTLAELARSFDATAPHASLPLLARAYTQAGALPDALWRARKQAEIARLMVDCAGPLAHRPRRAARRPARGQPSRSPSPW